MKRKQYSNLLDTLENLDDVGSAVRALQALEADKCKKKLRKSYYSMMAISLDKLYKQILKAY